jgi:hypothetical protein
MGGNEISPTKVGVFATRSAADQTVAELRAAGYRDEQIGLLTRDGGGNTFKADGHGETNATEGAAVGAAVGAGAGGLIGLAVMSGTIPVVGPVLALGALGTVLLNAAAGATLAGLTGALIGRGVPAAEVEFYEAELKLGRYLVTLDTGGREDAHAVFAKHGGYDRATARSAVENDPTA